MKKTFVLIVLLLLAACARQPQTLVDGHTPSQEHLLEHALAEKQSQAVKEVDFSQYTELRKAGLKFDGMTCPSCALGVEYVLDKVDGVVQSKVDYGTKTGLVVYEPSKVTPQEIVAASDVYPATLISDDEFS